VHVGPGKLVSAVSRGFGSADYVGSIPLGQAAVGLAVSPDGRWLYATSQQRGPTRSMNARCRVLHREASHLGSQHVELAAWCGWVEAVLDQPAGRLQASQ
jgi:hypothetical protein